MQRQRWLMALIFAAGACAGASASSRASSPAAPNAAPPPAPAREGPPLVTPAEATTTKTSPNGQATVTILAQGDNAFVARLEMAAGAAVPEHQDATEEYIHILSGSGTITIDGRNHEVTTGTTIFMPPGATVSFRNADAPLSALQVFAGPGPAAKYDAWK